MSRTLGKVLLALAIPLAMYSQEFRAAISGAVTDSSGAPIAGAKVAVTETRTGTKNQAVSDNSGQYNVLFLLPGDYDIEVQSQGFKDYVRKALHVGAGDHPVIDVRLTIGDAAQTVEVVADVPIVNSENASVGQAITTKEVEDLPINGRSPLMLAQLAIGVIMSPYNSSSTVQQPYDSSNPFSIGGTATQTSEMLLDGSPNATWDGRSAFSPPMDSVQEVRVKAFDTDSAFGHTGGGTINVVMKTGTNSLHGSLYEFNQPSNLTANNFFNNKNGLGNPVTHFNQYGLTAGGPVLLPKLLNGRNKLFWFFSWETDKNSQPNNAFMSVPTDAEKKGDFSQILKTDGTQLYDPYSGRLNGSIVMRDPYPNNQIPASQFNPISVKYLQFYPEPNVAAGSSSTARPDGYFNYGTNARSTNDFNSELGRLDYNMSDKSRMSFGVRHNALFALKNDYFNNISNGTITNRENWGANLDEVYTLNATNIINLRINYTFINENISDPSAGFDPSTLGFPSYIAGNSTRFNLPYIYFDKGTGLQSLGPPTGTAAKRPSQSVQLFSTWTHIHGAHTLKGGFDIRQYRLSTLIAGYSSGGYNFGSNSWVRSASNASTTVAMGQDMAQLMLGLLDQGFYDINTSGFYYSYYVSGFVQDDWRVRNNLTVNLGIRYDHDGPYHEKFGRTVSGWGFGVQNPVAQAAMAAYAKSPAPQLAASDFNVLGGLLFPSNGNTAVYQNTSHLASPRIGFAWTPGRLHNKTVVRGGLGMFVAPITIAYLAQNGNYSSTPVLDQEGFSQQTTLTPTTNNYLSPGPVTISNPFPTGLLQPAGSSAGLKTFIGQTATFLNPEMKSPYSLRWNLGFQQTLTANTMLEVLYIGNHAVHLPINLTQLNGVARQYLSTSPTRDSTLITNITKSIANPFLGLVTSGTPAGATTSVAQLLSHYPEFPLGYTSGTFTGSGGVMEQNLSVGSSYFHSLNVRVLHRLSRNLSVTGNYIYSKLIDQSTWLNDTDPRPEKRIGVFDHTHRGVIAVTYDLPFGKGKKFAIRSRWLDTAFGGWHINGMYTRQTGQPFAFMHTSSTTIGDYTYFGAPLDYHPRETNGLAFNINAFTPPVCQGMTAAAYASCLTANQLQYNIRTFSTTFSSLRGDGVNQLNGSMLKRIDLREKMYLQLRFECFNVMNHPIFAFPNVAETNSAFGLITAQSNQPRSIQAGAKFVF
jgi:hypothetical protein